MEQIRKFVDNLASAIMYYVNGRVKVTYRPAMDGNDSHFYVDVQIVDTGCTFRRTYLCMTYGTTTDLFRPETMKFVSDSGKIHSMARHITREYLDDIRSYFMKSTFVFPGKDDLSDE